MPGTKEGALKRIENLKARGYDFSKAASYAGKHSSGGFSTDKVGTDGLTGRERASIAGKKKKNVKSEVKKINQTEAA